MTRSLRQRDQPPVDQPKGGGSASILPRRPPPGRPAREQAAQCGAKRKTVDRAALQLRSVGYRDPALAHGALQEHERDQDHHDDDQDLDAADDERPCPLDLAEQRLVLVGIPRWVRLQVGQDRLQKRLEDRVDERGEIAEWQEDEEEELSEEGGEHSADFTQDL